MMYYQVAPICRKITLTAQKPLSPIPNTPTNGDTFFQYLSNANIPITVETKVKKSKEYANNIL